MLGYSLEMSMTHKIFTAAALFVFGTIIGSFLNVVIYRTPKKEQIVSGRSHCMSCGHSLAWYDLLPILSWIGLKGNCRYCKVKISGRYALVETICGLSYLTAFIAQDIQFFDDTTGFIRLGFALVLFPILICLAFIDYDTGEIEYWCPISIAVLGIIAIGFSVFNPITNISWWEHLIGAVIISFPFAILAMLGGMGGGDVQLMAAAGLLLGWRNILPAALIGIFLGAIIGTIYKLSDKSPENQTAETINEEDSENSLPTIKGTVFRFGPCLAIGIAAAFLYGEELIGWYMSFMRG